MKTIIKILIAVAILTACFNASRAALNNYQFQDAVHEGLLFDGRANDAEIVEMVTKLAAAHDVPIDPADIKIRQVGQDIHIDMSYTRNVVLVPSVFARDWTFRPSTSTKLLVGNRRQ
jgi:hypothetical protein